MKTRDWVAEAMEDLDQLPTVYESVRALSMPNGASSTHDLGSVKVSSTAPLPIDTRPIDLTRGMKRWAAELSPIVRGTMKMGLEEVTPTTKARLTFIAGCFSGVNDVDPVLSGSIARDARRFLNSWNVITHPELVVDRDDRIGDLIPCPECGGRLYGYRNDFHVECAACGAWWDFDTIQKAYYAISETE